MVDPIPGELPKPLRLLAFPSRFLPLGPALTLAVRRFARRRPAVFERLGEHARASFLVEATDLGQSFLIIPDGMRAEIKVLSSRSRREADVHVKGPILVLLGLIDGTFDGDALFFNRAITVSGKTDALLALRNTIEDAELKPSDLAGLTGEAARLLDKAVFGAIAGARRLSGSQGQGEAA
ncbi:ubiquinone anaerobic biosynthesis accessory factor UbiT [Oryzibacter oryziterrae]|uniref:ubiquinone anaerobic biosynthesis accessory factor UbiT n=1 Tax=Oryzibacter oryziterrae TaxID=2766474 RepID=UPI001F29A232|nr:SCP2 sterol-binding domain-containing protein [Oryzibacter oryziterrae]